jgi:glycosyltransferase involved in cell wall biosynthesis
MMGRCVREKGYPDLFEAWKAVIAERPEARLLCVSPELESERDRYAEEARRFVSAPEMRGSVVLTGFRDDVSRLLQAADLFALPSWREGMPRSILEAMGCGIAVIATDIRGSREEVVDGETGILVPVRHPEALGQAMLRLLSDNDRRQEMGRAGRRRAEAQFDERLVIQAQEEIYRQLFLEKRIAWPEQGCA